ncbi:MAG: hypothetical protein JWN50_340 [Parcubacteria group bacterium]|nr:hypothetical protein [Parcubacteria group bacterium]
MVSDYDKRLEDAKRARMQGIRLKDASPLQAPAVQPKRNRIEEALGGKIPDSQFSISNQDPIPNLQKKIEVPYPDPSLKIAKLKTGNSVGYGRFLRNLFLGLAIIVLLVIIGVGGYAVFQHYSAPQTLSTNDVVSAVGKLVELPQGETPTVATVTDLAPLAGQDFFKDAAVGDKVLIFGASKKAILYRPNGNKIIQIAPLNN